MSLAPDLWIRHQLAQQAKGFFGYGPKGKATVVLQGRVAVFTSELVGPGMVTALKAEPFGRLCMRYINHCYVQSCWPELERLAGTVGVRLLAVGSDLDFDAGLSIGVAVAAQPLPGALPERPDPALAARLGASAGAVGPALITAWLPEPLPPPDAEGTWLRVWADRRAAAVQALSHAVGGSGRAAFLVPIGKRCLAGIIDPT